ncbi:hypothetical protein D1B31_13765 [Neobacillus notoginsengisoli]|uniref:Uncharacterized protein n=1 Tax=Neobacillus notoginsengisoli TaxID=1578198 RepID=A0A417YSN8_9BACI|nr:hypothetical protein [Neobacillus notoginsengisoli]RHW39025.1 hypothetical protein D1B31_13765 [Neobacillus notoginsengisoli]
MDWMLLFVMAICMLFIHLNKGPFRPKEFLKELLTMSVFIVIYLLLKSYLVEKLTFKSPFAKIPPDTRMWVGGGVFLLITCGFSYVSWKKFKLGKEASLKK